VDKVEEGMPIREALFHGAEIVIEPVEGVFHNWQDGRHVPGVVQNVFFVGGGCAEGTKHRFLAGFQGKLQILAVVDHQDGRLDARGEVHGIGFRKNL
jgi:hypothetical protein